MRRLVAAAWFSPAYTPPSQGTDATIAQHVATIQARLYATKDAQQCFTPTPLGCALVEGYNQMGYQLNKPALRAQMEADCLAIVSGTKQRDVSVSGAALRVAAPSRPPLSPEREDRPRSPSSTPRPWSRTAWPT